METGQFVRTSKNGILKINKNVQEISEAFKTIIDDKAYNSYEIIKSSFNLIDLIEVGDFVNGERVGASRYGLYVGFDEMEEPFMLEDIKIYEVLTHELYEANCYKVGE